MVHPTEKSAKYSARNACMGLTMGQIHCLRIHHPRADDLLSPTTSLRPMSF
jgi:hypothetical protein